MPVPAPPDYLTISAEELHRRAGSRLVVLPDRRAVYEQFARSIADEIAEGNAADRDTVLILPVGPVGGYPVLSEVCNQQRISWKRVHVFNMDEYLDWQGRPIPTTHPLSFTGFMDRFYAELAEDLRPLPQHCHFPSPFDPDAVGREIERLGGVDTCYGGVGVHGHLAFNEPPLDRWRSFAVEEFATAKTRVLPLAPETMVMNCVRALGGHFASLPPMCVTLGMAECLGARRVRLYCDGGEWQRTALRTGLLGPVGVEYPVTLTQRHPDVTFVCDVVTAQPAIDPSRTLWDAGMAAAGR
ncbi:MAG TPA: glucosamine-6-phosphate isomerase [Chloroflexota bacterium]|nr:glucosamine-6-phosphate isomerase [Chloroflexota bacterium]